MKKEVEVAAKWWTDNLLISGIRNEQILKFNQILENELLKKYKGHWYPQDPKRGSGFRAIVFDARLDTVLESAAMSSGIKDVEDRLPRAIVWPNPGFVKICTLDDERMSIVDIVNDEDDNENDISGNEKDSN